MSGSPGEPRAPRDAGDPGAPKSLPIAVQEEAGRVGLVGLEGWLLSVDDQIQQH